MAPGLICCATAIESRRWHVFVRARPDTLTTDLAIDFPLALSFTAILTSFSSYCPDELVYIVTGSIISCSHTAIQVPTGQHAVSSDLADENGLQASVEPVIKVSVVVSL